MRILFLVSVLAAAAACSRPASKPVPASFLLVTIGTVRADRLGCMGDAAARTPRLDALAREGVLFERAYTPAPITLPAHTSILTGLDPPAHGVRGNGAFALGPGVPTLAEVLKARGLRTGAFVGGFPLVRRFGLDRGFDRYDDAMARGSGLHYEFAERRADAVVEAATAWLAGTPGPVFAWVHLFDPHAPYDPPPAFAAEDAYGGEIAAVDAAVARLLADWDARPERAMVAVTSDHGEAFGEHGEESHSLFLYDVTLQVPLIVRVPGVAGGRRVSVPVGIVDLAATALDLLGAPGGLPGHSLRPLLEGRSLASRPLYAETLAPRLDFGWSDLRAWREDGHKYIGAPRPELYDVAADPGETHDLAEARPEGARRLAARLDAALAATPEAESRRGADPEAAERLRALGYVQGPQVRMKGADPKDRIEVARRIARAGGPFLDQAAVVSAYREIAALDPDNPVVNLRLADALLRSGRPEQAIAPFRKVIARAPRSVDPFVGLATAYARLGRLEEARKVLTDALRVAPGDGQIHYNLGEVARERGDVVTARREFEAALADPVTLERARSRLEGLR